MYAESSVYPKTESGFALKAIMNVVYVYSFNDQTFNQDGNESAIVKRKYYNQSDLKFQHLPVKEKVKNIEVNTMRTGFIIDILSSVDIQKVLKNGGKVIEIYEGVIYRQNLKYRLLEKI